MTYKGAKYLIVLVYCSIRAIKKFFSKSTIMETRCIVMTIQNKIWIKTHIFFLDFFRCGSNTLKNDFDRLSQKFPLYRLTNKRNTSIPIMSGCGHYHLIIICISGISEISKLKVKTWKPLYDSQNLHCVVVKVNVIESRHYQLSFMIGTI